jgi:hypothetical protein
MKKLSLVLAIVLGMGAMAFAQDVEVYEEAGLFGKGAKMFQNRSGESLLLPDEHGSDDDANADAPLGSGILLLTGMGAAYLLSNKKKD